MFDTTFRIVTVYAPTHILLSTRAATNTTFGIRIFGYLNERIPNYLLTLIHTEFCHRLSQIDIFSYSTHKLLSGY